VDLRIYVEPGKEDRCAWAMDALKRSMRWDEERFGCEYDLDVFNIVAVSDFNMGAMENKGLNIFNDRLILATAKTATDQNYADIERVIAHEYFHNWTGNRITCRDWFQLCLKEGLTVYRDQEFAADTRSRAVQRITEVRNLRARQFSEDAGPLAHPVRPDSYVEINNFYTATVYDKGAEICRMIATLLGADAFRRGMDLYLTRHDGEAATVEQFVACFEEVSGRDLSQFMLWYSEAGTPRVVCNVSHDPAKAILTVDLEQVLPPTPGQAKKKPKHIPLRIGLISADGREIPATAMDAGADVRDGLVELRRRREKIRFRDVTEAPLVSINRGFSAPVVVVMNQSARDLADLIRNDSDPFNRWQAAQTLACDLMVQWTSDLKAGRHPAAAPDYTRAVAHVVSDEKLETAFRAAMATLPSEADVARALEKDIDPDAIHRARLHLRKQLAAGLGGGLHDLRRRYEVRGRYAPDQKQSGARALRNALLNLMAARGRAEDLAALEQQFRDAQNATDEIAAFALLAYCAGPRRTAALEHYFGKWHAEPLMIDHWFTVQAAAPRTGGLVAVKRLTKHPLYSWRNPNKVRSLLFAFASLNLLGFNRPDGQGYDFIASCVARLDAINPQMAARLLGVFRSWPTLEAGRRAKAKSALEHLAKRPGLSRDVSEILAKMLDA
jgi:aminopeptidase N